MNTSYLHKRFINNTSVTSCLTYQSSILLSISGGQDSLGLLKIVLDFTNNYQWKVGLVYFDHKLRFDSRSNLQQVLNIARKTRLELFVYENTFQSNNEIEYRKWRYKILLMIALSKKYSRILTAHTMTDLGETFLQRMFKGTIIDSMISINFSTQYSLINYIIRPLLQFRRVEVSWLSKKFCLPVWSDYTNYCCKYARNKLRQELIPYIQYHFQPKIHEKILSFIARTQQDVEYLYKATIKLYFLLKHPHYTAINYTMLKTQPKALQYRVIKLFFKHNFNIIMSNISISQIMNHTVKNQAIVQLFTILELKLLLAYSWIYAVVK